MIEMKRPLFVGILFVVSLAAGPALAIQVDLGVDTGVNPPALKVTSNSNPCDSGPSNSECIEVAKGSQPHMYFNLKNACKEGGPGYKLMKFRITEKNKDWPSLRSPMNQEVAKDFCADRNSGYVELRNCRNQRKDDKLKLKNFNSKEANVYYEITAEPCSGSGDAIYLDPVIRNKGNN